MTLGSAISLLGALACAAACSSATDAGTTSRSVVGQWGYSATQSTPVTATLTGTLSVTQQTGHDFQGTLDVIQQDGQGNMTHLAGIVSGQVLDSASLVFTAFLDLVGRQHLATIARDSVHGTWVEQESGFVNSGSFVAALRTSP